MQEGFKYLREVKGLPELTSSYKSMKRYSELPVAGSIDKRTENYEEVNAQVREITRFGTLLQNSYWQTYTPFNTIY